jgi:D-3-phosphoglycerate dehydrogenase
MGKYKVVIVDREYNNTVPEARIMKDINADLFEHHYKDPENILRVARDCDALIVHSAHITREIIEGLERCKVIARYASGADRTDVPAATERGILVTCAKDYCNEEVASHALALLMSLNRQIPQFSRELRTNVWFGWYAKPPYVPGLNESVVGIIGFGRISRNLIAKLRYLSKEIWVYSRSATAEAIADCGAVKKTFDEIVEAADYISIHCPLDESTAHLFNMKVFSAMKPTAQIVNVARGGIVCEADLIRAVETGQIAGAALDVLEQEPPNPDNPLLHMDKVIVTPHSGWYSEGSQRRLQTIVAESVAAVLTGGKPEFCVNEAEVNASMIK